tara:strand:+ start:17125 stop:17292 length:168 start_codon:yes stop_codon:yes gene_type:complete
MGVEKGDPLIRHFLEVRGLDLAVRVGWGDVPDSEVVSEDENDVGSLGGVGVNKAV